MFVRRYLKSHKWFSLVLHHNFSVPTWCFSFAHIPRLSPMLKSVSNIFARRFIYLEYFHYFQPLVGNSLCRHRVNWSLQMQLSAPYPNWLQWFYLTPTFQAVICSANHVMTFAKLNIRDFTKDRTYLFCVNNAGNWVLSIRQMPKGSIGHVSLWPTIDLDIVFTKHEQVYSP